MGTFILLLKVIFRIVWVKYFKIYGLVPFSVASVYQRLLEAVLEVMDLNIKLGHVACLDVGFNCQVNQIFTYNCDLICWSLEVTVTSNYTISRPPRLLS